MTESSELPCLGIDTIEPCIGTEPKITGLVFYDRSDGGMKKVPIVLSVAKKGKLLRLSFYPVMHLLGPNPKYAAAKQIEVEIHYDDRRLRDGGKGIDPKLLCDDGREGHFGLRGMRERAKLIGKLTVWSELDAGMEVELTIPATRAYTTVTDGQQISLTEKFLANLSGRGTMKKP